MAGFPDSSCIAAAAMPWSLSSADERIHGMTLAEFGKGIRQALAWLDRAVRGQPLVLFEMDGGTLEALDALGPVFGVATRAQVIRKALALARVAAQHCERVDGSAVLRIQGADGSHFPVRLDA
jgi:hypothetical protein